MPEAHADLQKMSADFDNHQFFDAGDDFAAFMKLALPPPAAEAELFLQ